jgi:hypothetical protein
MSIWIESELRNSANDDGNLVWQTYHCGVNAAVRYSYKRVC